MGEKLLFPKRGKFKAETRIEALVISGFRGHLKKRMVSVEAVLNHPGISRTEACGYWGVTEAAAIFAERRGDLPRTVKEGRRLCYTLDALIGYALSRRIWGEQIGVFSVRKRDRVSALRAGRFLAEMVCRYIRGSDNADEALHILLTSVYVKAQRRDIPMDWEAEASKLTGPLRELAKFAHWQRENPDPHPTDLVHRLGELSYQGFLLVIESRRRVGQLAREINFRAQQHGR